MTHHNLVIDGDTHGQIAYKCECGNLEGVVVECGYESAKAILARITSKYNRHVELWNKRERETE